MKNTISDLVGYCMGLCIVVGNGVGGGVRSWKLRVRCWNGGEATGARVKVVFFCKYIERLHYGDEGMAREQWRWLCSEEEREFECIGYFCGLEFIWLCFWV